MAQTTDRPDSARRRPSRGWYGIALVVMLVGVAAFVASVKVAQEKVADRLSQMQRFVAPGSTTLTFDRPGRYLVYYEKVGEFDGRSFDTTRVFRETPALDVDLRHDMTGEYVTVQQVKYEENQAQMFNAGRANSEFVFTLPPESFAEDAAGSVGYTISAAHENPEITEDILLAVGPPVVGDLMSDWWGPFGGAAVLAFAFVLSSVAVLVVFALRHGWLTPRQPAQDA
jgi:hypothetical protein